MEKPSSTPGWRSHRATVPNLHPDADATTRHKAREWSHPAEHHRNIQPTTPREPLMTDVVAAINAALDTTASIVEAVPAAASHQSTPCSAWDVHQVANHLVGGMRIFAGELTGAP